MSMQSFNLAHNQLNFNDINNQTTTTEQLDLIGQMEHPAYDGGHGQMRQRTRSNLSNYQQQSSGSKSQMYMQQVSKDSQLRTHGTADFNVRRGSGVQQQASREYTDQFSNRKGSQGAL